ncbi:hypothetical protein GJA_1826 [Janthinobacterium agaricidamnosum NBRC 102515 = DSM 9628]|uniref:Uncharacterized protein n=1 Tax=Janthinobacterium agaricidamnosum NBRC 102515 = DSM 9628 TaxID=1349767 RepID=W0V5D9_9BURK|nr:hypothetical protein GJA_1826 [Janthinobacterium agaricidamnosum NBRC 102515 = DSM 9628]
MIIIKCYCFIIDFIDSKEVNFLFYRWNVVTHNHSSLSTMPGLSSPGALHG